MGHFKEMSMSYGTVGEAAEDRYLDRRDNTHDYTRPATKPKTTKPPTTLPTPRYEAPGRYFCPAFDMRRRANNEGYTLTLEEHGWRCSCVWCSNPYGCLHVNRLADYFLERDIEDAIPEVKPLSVAQKEIAAGHDLAWHFDYSAATIPTHQVTNRTRVRAR